MPSSTIVIIGAGITGLSCARTLANHGQASLILEKGRGVGGRVSTRRAQNGMTFDHGAQYITAKSEEFRSIVDEIRSTGAAAFWEDGSGAERIVGTPGMSALAKYLAAGLNVQTGKEVDRVYETSSGWVIGSGDNTFECQKLIITAPAAQTARLLGENHPLFKDLSEVIMTPCLTLMAAFGSDQPKPFITRRDPDDVLAWIALNSAKPDRLVDNCWIAQAGPEWSAQRLECDLEDTARAMSVLLCERLGADINSINHAVSHRWRYANVAKPLGSPFLRNEQDTLYLGGDWCLKGRVEAAWASGNAIAQKLLKTS